MYQYVIVRKNMSPEQCLVQATHAATVAQEAQTSKGVWGRFIPPASKRTLIVLEANSKFHLWYIRFRMTLLGISHSPFFEPEPWEPASGGLTAISFFEDPRYVKLLFLRKLQLLTLLKP